MRYQLRHAPIDGAKLAFFFKLTNTHARQYDFLAVQTKCKPSAVLVGFNSNYETHTDLPRLCRGSRLSLCCLRPALITPDEALDRISATFASQSGKLRGPALSRLSASPVVTMEKDGENTVYVFGDTGNKGYVVASADDIAIPMLGYSDTGVITDGDIPPALR